MRILRWIGVAFSIILMAGCVQTAVIPEPEPSVVVKGLLMNDTIQQVSLYYSGTIGATTYDPVEDAFVVVTETGGVEHLFTYAGGGKYLSDFRPVPSRKYKLQVTIPGRDTLSATTTFPQKMSIQSHFFPPALYVNESYWDQKNPSREEVVEFNRMFPWGYNIAVDQRESARQIVGASILAQMPGIIYELETSYPEAVYVVGVNEEKGVKTRAQSLATNHLFVDPANRSKSRYHWDSEPGPSSSIHRCYDDAIATTNNGLPLHTGYLRIASPTERYDNGLGQIPQIVRFLVGASHDNIDASPLFAVVGDISYNYWWDDARQRRSSLYFCSVSPEYDRYLQDCWQQTVSTEGDLLASLYVDASRIYTNIQGGYGVFGAMNVLRHDCDLQQTPAGTPVFHTPLPFDCCLAYPAYTAPLPEL